MRQWLISKIPTWVLRCLVWRNFRLHRGWDWADIELGWRKLEIRLGYKVFPKQMSYRIHEYKNRLVITVGPEKPAGVPEWLLSNPRSYGYEDESEEGSRDDL